MIIKDIFTMTSSQACHFKLCSCHALNGQDILSPIHLYN